MGEKMAKVRIILWVGDDNIVPLENSEAESTLKILEVLPQFNEWTLMSELAKKIGKSTLSTTNTVFRLAVSRQIESDNYGQIEVIAQAPIINIKKGEYNHRRNITKQNFRRAPFYFKNPTSQHL